MRAQRITWMAAMAALLLTPLAAHAGRPPYRPLSPAAADKIARKDLLSMLQPTGRFTRGMQSIESATFVTWPFQDRYTGLCREDELVVGYDLMQRHDNKGAASALASGPENLGTRHLFHLEQIPVHDFPGRTTDCTPSQPGPQAAWFAAETATDAVRAAYLFRMAEDQVKAGSLTPGPCPGEGQEACRRRVIALDDFSRVTAVAACPTQPGEDACYVFYISYPQIPEMTVAGKMSESEPTTPTTITSVRAQEVVVVTE